MDWWNHTHINTRAAILENLGRASNLKINFQIAQIPCENLPPEIQKLIGDFVDWKKKDIVSGKF